MLWPRRQLLLAAACLPLAACGFEPVYGPNGGAQSLQNRVALAEPGNRDAYLLAQRIEGRMGRAADPAYRLETVVSTSRDGLATTPDGKTTRYHLVGSAAYTLRTIEGNAVIAKGRVQNFVGYSATGTTVATLAAERDAQSRLMTILADQIVDRLIVAAPAP